MVEKKESATVNIHKEHIPGLVKSAGEKLGSKEKEVVERNMGLLASPCARNLRGMEVMRRVTVPVPIPSPSVPVERF